MTKTKSAFMVMISISVLIAGSSYFETSFAEHDIDSDPDTKVGGKDPLVFGTNWHYDENDADRCETQYKFDYDNDGFLESFCYEIVGSIFVVDFNNNGNVDNGIEMLNFDKTDMSYYTPTTYLTDNPDTCKKYNCYLWHDTNEKNWIVDEYELVPFSFEIEYIRYYPDGKKLVENQRYVYCIGQTTNNETFYCLQPTYWQKGI